jgi:hypothetical protein
MTVFSVLKSSECGWVEAKTGGPTLLGVSPVLWLIGGGLLWLWLFIGLEMRIEARGREPLVRPSIFDNKQLNGGLTQFFFQFFLQAGIFFTVPLFLSVVLELSALETGLRLLPLSISLLISATGIPKYFPTASPRRIVQIGLLCLIGDTLC